jgi:uncharacterized Zn-binding protein involved in type VI secretion
MPPAARVTDMHVCPMVTVLVPHVGGPILPPGVPTVLIDFLPAATITNMLTCVGPPDVILMGSTGVFMNYLPAARMGDPTAHGGVIILGSVTCMIGEMGSGSPGAGGLGGVTAGLAAAGLSNPINPNASVYGSPGTAAPPSGSAPPSSAAGSPSGTPLTPDVMQAISQSPALAQGTDDIQKAGWTVKYGTPGCGTYADAATMSIVVDPSTVGNLPVLLPQLAQEVRKASPPAPPVAPGSN